MTFQLAVSKWFPDRPPTWTEVIIAVFVAVAIFPDLLSPSTMSWPMFVVGFLSVPFAVGPIARTAFGRWVGRWYRRIGAVGRAIVIGLFMFAVLSVVRTGPLSSSLVRDFGVGGMVATFVYLIAHLMWAGTVSGWRVNWDETE